MADFLGYLSQFVTDANLVVPLHDPAQGVYVEGIMLPSIAYRTNLTPLASGAIHDADGNQRSKFDVATIDHVMVIKKSNLAILADFYNALAKLLTASRAEMGEATEITKNQTQISGTVTVTSDDMARAIQELQAQGFPVIKEPVST